MLLFDCLKGSAVRFQCGRRFLWGMLGDLRVFVEILLHVVDEHGDRRGNGHGVLADQMDGAVQRTAVLVAEDLPVHLRTALRQQVAGDDRMTEPRIDQLHTGEAVIHGQQELRRIAHVLPPPPGARLIQSRIGPVPDRRLCGERLIVDGLGGNEIHQRIGQQDVHFRPLLIAPDDRQLDVLLLHQLRQLVAGHRREGQLDIAVPVHEALQQGRHVGLREGAARADAEHAGHRVRLVGHKVFHVLIPLELLFRIGEEAVARVREMDPFIGADEERHADLLFHLVQAVGERRLRHEEALGHFIDAPFLPQVDQNFPVCIVHLWFAPRKLCCNT